ncbi:unnamed protein product [Protopolystoma xenopodis]|uniref:2-oxoisovalerate dehydrogenase subunit alpha n=1 Tax=Protopolystoma xenopodis TaxID=117903 RepID=A0A3S5BF50_9PLAT|nr:unnamed protein product [Protopolystoma xenopodis]
MNRFIITLLIFFSSIRRIATITGLPVCCILPIFNSRVGHHSTSDDSSAYRSIDEVQFWEKEDNPILRLKKYLIAKGWWSDEEEQSWLANIRKEVIIRFY